MNELLTTGALARATGYSVENVRTLERRGVIRAQRDSNGRRLFSREHVAIIAAYRHAHMKASR